LALCSAAALLISSSLGVWAWIGVQPLPPNYASQGGSLKGSINTPAAVSGIDRVTVYWRALDMSVSGRESRCAIKCEGATMAYGPSQALTGSWVTYQYTWNTNPETGSAWQKTDLDGITIGVQQLARTGADYTRVTQVYLAYYLSGVTTNLTPNADSADGTWLNNAGGASLYDYVDDAVGSPDDGGTYVYTWTQNDLFLVNVTDPP
jgi:hypothetical protein